MFVRSTGFSARGFVIENCMASYDGSGILVIESESNVTLESTIFRANGIRAIFVASKANLTLESCFFENNYNPDDSGGAIFLESYAFLSIKNSNIYSTPTFQLGLFFSTFSASCHLTWIL